MQSAACSLHASVLQAASVEQRDQLPVKLMRTELLSRVVVNLARHLRPRCATSTTLAVLSAKARLSRLRGGKASPGSVERPSRILPFRQSIYRAFSKQRQELDLNAPVIGTYHNAAAQVISDGADDRGRGPESKISCPRAAQAPRETLWKHSSNNGPSR